MKEMFTRAELLEALALEPCHVTGQHDPNHTPRHVCSIQRAEAFERVLELLGVTEEELPKRLHEGCGWCHEVPSQEEYRIGMRRLHAWAGKPISEELAAPGSDAERFTEERVLAWLEEASSYREIYPSSAIYTVVEALVAKGLAEWAGQHKTRVRAK